MSEKRVCDVCGKDSSDVPIVKVEIAIMGFVPATGVKTDDFYQSMENKVLAGAQLPIGKGGKIFYEDFCKECFSKLTGI